MRGNARHVRVARARSRHRRPLRRAATLLTAAVASACVLAGAVLGLSWRGLAARLSGTRLAASSLPAHADRVRAGPVRVGSGGTSFTRVAWSAGKGGAAASSGALSLTQAERRACPEAARACVDLKGHLTWLQSGGEVTYGPVRMEPGAPGTPSATPPGTFRVQWKAGPRFVSREYGDPMPWATFFAPGGVAFHGGSLTQASHGCVHLTTGNARYFQAHLPLGAEVVVF